MGYTEVHRREMRSNVRLEHHQELEKEVLLLVEGPRMPDFVSMAEMQVGLVQRPEGPRKGI